MDRAGRELPAQAHHRRHTRRDLLGPGGIGQRHRGFGGDNRRAPRGAAHLCQERRRDGRRAHGDR